MFNYKIIVSFFSILIVVGCGSGKGENLVVNPPKVNVPASPTNLKSKLFMTTKNKDGDYTTFKGDWVVPELVTSVKIIGCSGGNGGGGGGAGGAGAKFFTGNWSGASFGGNGSSGGYANNKPDQSFIAGASGSLGKYGDGASRWFNALQTNGGYPQAQSATVGGEVGGLGEQSFFGNYKFSTSSENLTNKNNIIKIKTYVSEEDVCFGASGGSGGSGGAGGEGGEASIDNAAGDYSTVYYVGGRGGRGGNGGTGFHALVEETIIKVTPGEMITIQVGQGGSGGMGSSQITGGQSGSFGTNGKNGRSGANGQSGKPGAIYIQWIGL